MDGYQFPCDPVANRESTVTGPKYRFTVLDDHVLRYEWAEDGHFEDRASTFALWRNFPKPAFRVEDKGDTLELVTPAFQLTYDKQEFSPSGFSIIFSAKLSGGEWRYGQTLAEDNLGGTARTLDNVDGKCDMGLGILSKRGFSHLNDSTSMLFDKDGWVTPRRKGRRVDGYIFAYGLDYKGAMKSFYRISGSQPSVPRWCLGNWWSRYHAYDSDEYLNLMDEFKKNGIPLSVAVVDMDWHWVKEAFVPTSGWTGYSWNTNLFPSPRAFAQSLHDRDLKLTLNDHPHQGVHKHENVYKELAKRLGHDISTGDPVLFDPTSRAFMQAFFDLVHRQLEDIGCDFWWIDWQQGTESRIPGFDPLWLLNHFQYLDTRNAHPNSLPMIFSRYAGPGSHRYPVGFSGDTVATWASLQFQPEFTATASNIGFGWWSHDIGGHMLGQRDDECTTRWIQYAVFSPVLRLHSTANRWMSKEPWLYRQEHMVAMREAMQFRHRLVPYIYSTAASDLTVLPLVQPLYWEYPDRDVAYNYPNQYFFGPSLVVSPIVLPRDPRTNLAMTKVWVPPRRHVDIFTGTVYDGDRELNMYRSLHHIPVLAPEGSIIPLDGDAVPANGCKNPDSYEVIVIVGRDVTFDGVIEDSRDDRAAGLSRAHTSCMAISFKQSTGRLSFHPPTSKPWTFRFMSTHIDPSSIKVRVGGINASDVICTNDGRDTVVRLDPTPDTGSSITIDLGPNPQLAVQDHTAAIENLLLDFQTAFSAKDQTWEIVQAKQPTTVKIGRLLSLGLDEVFCGPIAELMLADSGC